MSQRWDLNQCVNLKKPLFHNGIGKVHTFLAPLCTTVHCIYLCVNLNNSIEWTDVSIDHCYHKINSFSLLNYEIIHNILFRRLSQNRACSVHVHILHDLQMRYHPCTQFCTLQTFNDLHHTVQSLQQVSWSLAIFLGWNPLLNFQTFLCLIPHTIFEMFSSISSSDQDLI